MEVPDNIKERFSAIGSKLKVGGAEVGRKVSARMTLVGGRMKELFQLPTPGEKLVEDVTAENLRAPDWAKFMQICDMLNEGKVSGQEVVRGVKKRIMSKSAGVQLLALTLLETLVKNNEKMFSEVASERVLDEMVKLAEEPQTWPRCRDKALGMIEAWGEATDELGYLPVFEETYKSLRTRGMRFPGRDSTSLAPIFTPKASENSNRDVQSSSPGVVSGINVGSLSEKETFDVARNSAEVLSTVLASSPQEEVIKEELTISLVEQCRRAQLRVQRIAQRAGEGDDATLFEALTVNEELQNVLSKFEELSVSFSSQGQTKSDGEPAVVTAQVVHSQGYDPLSDLEDEDEAHFKH